jgi:hypothetical protein
LVEAEAAGFLQAEEAATAEEATAEEAAATAAAATAVVAAGFQAEAAIVTIIIPLMR